MLSDSMMPVGRLLSRLRRLTTRARILLGLWTLFLVLVGLRIHGSSIALAAHYWSPSEWNQHFLASPLLNRMAPATAEKLRPLLMARAAEIRQDEWSIETLWSLSQFSHRPRFPVINTNIGLGQNMLMLPWAPVWHISSLARPSTWGYLLLGPQAGLAWFWWGQVFVGFTGLFLLFELVLRRTWLAALGALWFCGSAYVVCWSLWPAYVVGLGALASAAVYWLLTQERGRHRVAAGVLLGISATGFAQQLYPPWQIPLGYAFAAVLVGLLIRDRKLIRHWREWRWPALLGILICVSLLGTFVASSWQALHDFGNSVYPGLRRLNGRDCSIERLFGAVHNLWTVHQRLPILRNESEASGFFLFFPAILVAVVFSRHYRRQLDAVGWLCLAVAIAQTVYCAWGFPQWLANLTLLSRAQGFRAQLAIGLLSILVSLYPLRSPPQSQPAGRRWLAILMATGLSMALFLWTGWQLHIASIIPVVARIAPWVWPAVLAGCFSLLVAVLLLGWARLFGIGLTLALLLTSGDFNPLMRGFPSPFDSDLGKFVAKIVERDRQSGLRSRWLPIGAEGQPLGTMLSTFGANSLGGTFEYPQPKLWKYLDPEGKEEFKWNRFSVTMYTPAPLNLSSVGFTLPVPTCLLVSLSPLHPAARQLGVRYVAVWGGDGTMREPSVTRLGKWVNPPVTLWRVP